MPGTAAVVVNSMLPQVCFGLCAAIAHRFVQRPLKINESRDFGSFNWYDYNILGYWTGAYGTTHMAEDAASQRSGSEPVAHCS